MIPVILPFRLGRVLSSLVAPGFRWLICMAVAATLLAPSGPPRGAHAQAAEAYQLLATWPVAGGAERVVVAPTGDIYTVASGGSRIERRSPNGVVVGTTTVVGAEELAVDDAGSMYVVSGRRQVTKYAAGGPLVWSYTVSQGFANPAIPGGYRPPYATAVVWNPVLAQVTVPYDLGGFFGGSEFRLRTYTRGGVGQDGFSPTGTTDTYGDAAALGDTIRLVNRTRNTIEVYRNGTPAGQASLAEPADRIAAAADGSHFALSRQRWLYKYASDGRVLAAWDALDVTPDPFSESVAADVDVDAAGNVYVADPAHAQIRVYGPDPDPNASPGPLPAPEDLGCQVFPDKFADPTRLRLGAQTKVTLRLDGGCPEVSERADIMLVVDVSGSMQEGGKLDAAKDAIETFMALKETLSPPGRDHVGLATFGMTSNLVVTLTDSSATVIAAARAMVADGGTNVGAGIDEAVRELSGPRRRLDAQPIIVLMTDGNSTAVTSAASLAAADRARYLAAPAGCSAEGTCQARLYAIGLGSDVDQDFLRIVATTPDLYYFAPDGSQLADVYATIARRIYATELLKSVRIVDKIPDNMTYVVDSAVPPAVFDPAANSLTWDLGIVPFAGTELSFWLLPEEVGTWPTNIVATYDGPDGLNEQQTGVFPLPRVVVEFDTPTPTATIPTPTGTGPPPTTTSTPTNTPPITNTPSPTRTGTASSTPPATITATNTPTATMPPTGTPSATPGNYTIYVVVVYNNVCFKRYADVALVIDASTTMRYKDPGSGATKLDAARLAASAFLDELTLVPDRHGRHDQAAIVWFNETAVIEAPLTADRASLNSALDRIGMVEGSRIDLGVTRGHEAVVDPTRHLLANAPVVVLLSDGIPNHTTFDAVFGAADTAKRDGTVIYTVGHGADVQDWALRRVASQPEDYFYAPDANQMGKIYRQIAGQVVCR